MRSLDVRAWILSLTFLVMVLGAWEFAVQAPEQTEAQSEY